MKADKREDGQKFRGGDSKFPSIQKGEFIARHILVDLYFGIDDIFLKSKNSWYLNSALELSCEDSGAEIIDVNHTSHNDHEGFTTTVVMRGSGATVHTWPKYGFATLDITMAGDLDPFKTYEEFISYLKEAHAISPRKRNEYKLFRGWIDE
jgi:S-adenosylmethionine/arginine decarboxylase-like enzyme